jgi:hypothetical protein
MRLVSVLALATALHACKKDEANPAPSETTAQEQPDGTDADDPTQAGEVALAFGADTTPAKSLDTLATSLAAIPQSDMGAQLVTAGTVAVSLLDSGYNDGECDGNGYPIAKEGELKKQGSETLEERSPNYPQRHFYCQVKVGTSPEALLGSIMINKGVLCAIEKAGGMDEAKYGQEQSLSIKVDPDCFSQEFITNMQSENKDGEGGGEGGGENGGEGAALTADGGSEFPLVVTVTKLTDDPNWDLSITTIEEKGGKSIYYFRSSETVLSGARVDEDPNGQLGPGYVYSVSTDGTIRFENRLGPSKGSGFTGSQHIRILVQGTFNKETKRIDSITRYEGASANLPQENGGSIVTIKGSVDGGFRTRGFACPKSDANVSTTSCYEFSSFEQTANSCVGKGKCEGNDGISLTADTFKYMLPGAASDNLFMAEFLGKVKLPLAFETVTLADIP